MKQHSFLLVVVVATISALIMGAPAKNEQLDKANANSPYVNDVIARNKAKLEEVAAPAGQEESSSSSPIPDLKEYNPKPAGTAFVRLIDDIFQIPIGVLQSVAKLLTNPFKQIVKHGGGGSPVEAQDDAVQE